MGPSSSSRLETMCEGAERYSDEWAGYKRWEECDGQIGSAYLRAEGVVVLSQVKKIDEHSSFGGLTGFKREQSKINK